MPVYPTATNRPYKIKRTDSAATVPGRVTFPQGTFVNPATSLTPRLPYQMGVGTQASGLSGVQGVPNAMYPRPAAPSNFGYNVNQRGRGYGQPAPLSGLGYDPAMRGRGYGNPDYIYNRHVTQGGFTPQSIGVGNTGPGPGSYMLSEYGPDKSYLTPSQLAGTNASLLDPTSEYNQTGFAQQYAADNTPFLQQKRWDPQLKKYVSIGRLLKQGKLDLKGNWHRRSKRQKITNAVNRRNAQAQQTATTVEQPNVTATAFVNFRA